jgi:hypothetical protein
VNNFSRTPGNRFTKVPTDTYTGINAAAKTALLGDLDRARTLADQVLLGARHRARGLLLKGEWDREFGLSQGGREASVHPWQSDRDIQKTAMESSAHAAHFLSGPRLGQSLVCFTWVLARPRRSPSRTPSRIWVFVSAMGRHRDLHCESGGSRAAGLPRRWPLRYLYDAADVREAVRSSIVA